VCNAPGRGRTLSPRAPSARVVPVLTAV
jgi:hypothetical protein